MLWAHASTRITFGAWRGCALSKTGKEVMIKFVLEAIPSYIMSIYIMSNSAIDDIEKMIRKFY